MQQRPSQSTQRTTEKSARKKRKKVKATSLRKGRLDTELTQQVPLLNRDETWLQFNARVLNEAIDPRTPLLERVSFLGIHTSNLDEFFMKRMGLIQQHARQLRHKNSKNHLSSLYAGVRKLIVEQQDKKIEAFRKSIRPELKKAGIQLLEWTQLNVSEKKLAERYYRQNLFPVLTPLAVDPGLPFPFISNLSISLGITLQHPDKEDRQFARVKIPKVFPQWIQLHSHQHHPSQFRFVSLIDIIKNNLSDLFPGLEVVSVMPFRITRNTEVEREEESAEDLLEMVAEELKQRRFGDVVRLEHGLDPDPWILRFLRDELQLEDEDVYQVNGLLDSTDLKSIADLQRPDLKNDPWIPLISPILARDDGRTMFEHLANEDLLVHHPYESFSASVERFVKQACDDPDVLAIKMTLYRTGDDSPFISWLISAAEKGKQVVVLIELKARFDEERNIRLAQKLEDAGVHVVYGVVGLKTHAKTVLVVRREGENVRSYVHLGTGNYNAQTARLYTDLGLFSSRADLCADVIDLFHYLTGRSFAFQYKKLLVAPDTMRDRLLEKIQYETLLAQKGKPARIIIKCNSVDDKLIINALYEASQAGVEVDLIVRGSCCLKPRTKMLSERIRVISIIGRFLEHSRILYFSKGESEPLLGEFLIGSADMMNRNLIGRIETLVPIEGEKERERIWEILDLMLSDRRQAWEMDSDGSYTQLKPRTETESKGTHQMLMESTKRRHQKEREKLDHKQEQLALGEQEARNGSTNFQKDDR